MLSHDDNLNITDLIHITVSQHEGHVVAGQNNGQKADGDVGCIPDKLDIQ